MGITNLHVKKQSEDGFAHHMWNTFWLLLVCVSMTLEVWTMYSIWQCFVFLIIAPEHEKQHTHNKKQLLLELDFVNLLFLLKEFIEHFPLVCHAKSRCKQRQADQAQ